MRLRTWRLAVVGGVLLAGGASADAAQPLNRLPQALPKTLPSCNLCLAMINGDGSVSRQEGVAKVTRLSEGTYDVRFVAPINDCLWNAALSDPGQGDPAAGMIAVTGRGRTNNGLFLKTFDVNGRPADRSFNVTNYCLSVP